MNEIEFAAVKRLFKLASGDTGQCGRVANLLLAWGNGAFNGKWDPTDIWSLDQEIVEDILTFLRAISRG